MNNIDLGYHPLGLNYGYYIDKSPQNVLEELRQQINNLQGDFSKGEKYNDDLAGEIEHEYGIVPQFQTKQYIKGLAQRFENESQYMTSNYHPTPTLNFDDLWVNFQQKYEYNPIHYHYGIYSFVIWYKVPFTFNNEVKYNYKLSEQNCNHGKFAFVNEIKNTTGKGTKGYQISPIKSLNLDIDKSKEGYVVIFPSNLSHIVYPFYSSDEYRITLAGNIRVLN
tara:strand:- start:59 stop:724 length:666 start_codon:yes stop_codon:yes gene_type:complete